MPVLCRIYGSNTYSSVFATFDTDGSTEPEKYTSGLYLRTGNSGIEYDASGAENLSILHGYNGGANSNMYFKFGGSSGNVRMTLNDAGNLGVGVTPCSALDIHKSGTGGTGAGDNLIVRGGNNNNLFGANQIRFGYSGGIGYSHAIKTRHNSGGNTDNALDFFIWTTSDAIETVGTKNVMSLTGTGNIGIGTCYPTEKLHLYCNGPSVEIRLENASNSNYVRSSGDNLNFYVANGEKLRITCTGLVGINTISPISILDVRGEYNDNAMTIRNSNGCSYSAIGYYNCQGILKAAIGIANNSGGAPFANNAYVYTPASTDFLFYINGADRLRINCNGKVGINSSIPNARLSVQSTGDEAIFSLRTAYSTCCNVVEAGTTGSDGYFKVSDAVGSIWSSLSGYSNTPTYFLSKVGIGSNSPNYRFDVQYSVADYLARICNNQAGDAAGLLVRGGSNIGNEILNLMDYSGNPRFLVGACGNISVNAANINTTYKLYVNGTFYAAGSSKDYKHEVCKYDTNTCLFMCLKPVTYQYKDEWKHLGKELKSETQIGLIAEDVAEVYPELAILVNEEDNKVVRNVDYEKLSIVLLSEVQKLRKELDELKTK
jgi:hypothetical protein